MPSHPFRIKHIPTGLYYRPLKGTGCNLYHKGKIYENDYMWNQLTAQHPEWTEKEYHSCAYNLQHNIFASRGGKSWDGTPVRTSKEELARVAIGLKIINGDIPVELCSNTSTIDENYTCIDISIWNNPNDWEKEYV